MAVTGRSPGRPGIDCEAVMPVRPPYAAVLLVLSAAPIFAQGPAGDPAPPGTPPPGAGDANPLPVVDAGGPTAAVTALAFSPDGRALYSAGYDKVVRVWRRDGNSPAFRPD